MVRKLIVTLILVGVSFISTSAYSEPPLLTLGCEEEPAHPCDVACGEESDSEMACDCPCWTDQRVEQSTCGRWNSIVGCWYF